ncbi:MAG TPA: efflux transporter outer membrane subunit [Gemmatimonadales bacterium]|nr:efflux transporter outer membrane subunit [Gemmatimonadales bacterium]
MSRTPLLLAAALAVSACAVGPRYREPAVAPAGASLGVTRDDGALRGFYDSLATSADSVLARPVDSVAGVTPAPAPPPLDISRAPLIADSTDLAWLEVLRDTTLLGLVRTAVRENRDVLTAQARIREFRAQLGISRSALLPEVTANGSASTNQIAIGAFEPTAYEALRVTADLAWELDFWGRIRRGVQASRADVEAEEASYRATLLTLVGDVSTAYLQLVELRQEEAIAERTLASRRSTLALARDRFAQGVISALDVHQFEAEVAVPAASLAQARRLRAEREHQLATLVGRPPFGVAGGGVLGAAVERVRVPDSIPASLLGRRPDVRAAERAYAASVARVGVAQAARLPTVSITGSYGSQATSAGDLFGGSSEVYQLQGGVRVPLFTGGRLANESRAAEARSEQARLQFEGTVLQAFREADDALVAVRTSRDQRAAQASQVAALRQAAELAELRYRGGVASYLEVLDAQRGLFSAELGLSQSQLLELSSVVQLFRALGGSWE